MVPCSSILPAPPRTSEPRQMASRTLPRTASGVSLPSFRPFGPTRPRPKFAQVEAQFSLAHITQDRTPYDYVVAHLDARYASEVRDILANPPTANLYEHLKTELIRRLSLSEDQKVRQLQSAELAERKSSQLLHHMRALAGNMEVQDSLLRALLLQRLPPHVQAILQAQLTLPLDQLAGIADRVIEVSLPPLSPTVQAVAAPLNTTELARRIDDIHRQLSSIERRLDQHLPTRHSQSRGQNTTPSQQPGDDDRCYYHRRFGDRARQCRPPCSARNQGNANGSS
ncbi:uncharacterized protein [Dermacentor andersoni]|uniref:uncharacterized protein n=1 Tax=Dermacentor andersoni TaxID=34620 RepID=UPI0021555D48|nr:uncharacterized protein LOC126523921 [Dermacentor andersoni]